MRGYIYRHTSPSGKQYIGQTTKEPNTRWGHQGKGYRGSIFYNAIQKYGWDNITHEIIEEIEFNDIDELNKLETFYINKYNTIIPNGYNARTSGENSLLSNHVKQKISRTLKGRKRSKESIEKMVKTNTGRKMSDEVKRNLSIALTGRKMPKNWSEICSKSKMGNKNRLGTKTSEQGLLNIRKALIERSKVPMTLETRKKISSGNMGKKMTTEAKNKISMAHLNIPKTESHKKALSEAHRLKYGNDSLLLVRQLLSQDMTYKQIVNISGVSYYLVRKIEQENNIQNQFRNQHRHKFYKRS